MRKVNTFMWRVNSLEVESAAPFVASSLHLMLTPLFPKFRCLYFLSDFYFHSDLYFQSDFYFQSDLFWWNWSKIQIERNYFLMFWHFCSNAYHFVHFLFQRNWSCQPFETEFYENCIKVSSQKIKTGFCLLWNQQLLNEGKRL